LRDVELFLFVCVLLNLFDMSKSIIYTPSAPNPVGPYSQAVLANDTLYASGQIALDPATGTLVNDTIEAETTQVMENLKAVLEAAGMGFNHVVSCSVFVADIRQYDKINAVYGKYFDEATAPARALVEVANLPKFVNVEVSLIAVR
jgi:2-iminobutanoate/2-iminopropanoate deaminase